LGWGSSTAACYRVVQGERRLGSTVTFDTRCAGTMGRPPRAPASVIRYRGSRAGGPPIWRVDPRRWPLKLLVLTRMTGLDPRGHGCTGQVGLPVNWGVPLPLTGDAYCPAVTRTAPARSGPR